MSDYVPPEVVREILLRLPAQSLLRFRRVCKAWRFAIDDPSFVKSHASGTQTSSTATVLIRTSTGRLYSISLDSLMGCPRSISLTRVTTLVLRRAPRLPGLPVPSCNGLILMSHFDWDKAWVIWNPLTRESHQLPVLYVDSGVIGSGIGYDHASDDHKVVRIQVSWDIERNNVYKFFVYSVKLGCWRMAKDFPHDLLRSVEWIPNQGAFLNGALHWKSRDSIIAFDLATEEYRTLPMPHVLSTEPDSSLTSQLLELGGCLVLSCYYFSFDRLDGWAMNDYGVKNSWVKLFSFKLSKSDARGYLRPIAYLKSKRQVILHNGREFFFLDVVKNSAKKVSIDNGFSRPFSSQIIRGSLFRLSDSIGDVVGGSVAEKRTAGVKRKRNKANKRFQYPLTVTDVRQLDLELVQ